MPATRHHSVLCQVFWTDAVSGNRRSSVDPKDPVELRFGLKIHPNFWTSFDTSFYVVAFSICRFGTFIRQVTFTGDTETLAGAPAEQLWLGLRFGRAAQATVNNGEDLVNWSAQVFFERRGGTGNGVSQWAVTPDQSSFMVEGESTAAFPGAPSERLTGGAGIPPGTPLL